jgi:hypothetical protein
LDEISKLINVIAEYASEKKLDFIPGTSLVTISGKVFGATRFIEFGPYNKNTFWIGVWPGLANKMLDHMINEIKY